MLKRKSEFDCHYFVKKLVKKGDFIIDLGANLGYYSVLFSKLTGPGGKVYSVEPVPLFQKILKKNTHRFSNVEIVPYAIGPNDNEHVKMGVPYSKTHFSHGRTHVLNENEEESTMTFNATMMAPNSLFQNLKQLDYIKCDIEGYEAVAIPLFEKIIEKLKPIIQIEVAPENVEQIAAFFERLNYQRFFVKNDALYGALINSNELSGDWILIPAEKKEAFSNLIH
ncbi:MAG: FkbM family methyltransferase [Prolixibacteraceae bacterium]|nr:FkbM family methyltransferase [Prolixibacteraceae bacterium]